MARSDTDLAFTRRTDKPLRILVLSPIEPYPPTGGWQTEVIQMDTLNYANAFQGFFNFNTGTFVTDDAGTPGITEGNAPLAFDAGQVVFGPTASTIGNVTMDVEFVQSTLEERRMRLLEAHGARGHDRAEVAKQS